MRTAAASSSSSAAGTPTPWSGLPPWLRGHGRGGRVAYAAAACLAVATFFAVAALDPAGTQASNWFLSSSSSASPPPSSSPSTLQRSGGVAAGELLLATSTSYSSSGSGRARNSTGKQVRQDVRQRGGGGDDDGLMSFPRLVNSSAYGRAAPPELSVRPAVAAAPTQAPVPAKEEEGVDDATQPVPPIQRKRDVKLERLELGLAKARAAIMEAIRNKSNRSPLTDKDYVPIGPIYRNAYAFHRSYLEMEKLFKVYVYEEGEPPVFHDGPCRSIYSTEGRFIHSMEMMEGRMRTRDPARAHAFFLPFSIVKMVKTLYEPGSHDMGPIRRTVADYVGVVASKHPYWNRSLGADHFMLSCHDWGPYVSSANAQLFSNSIRVLCNANTSEGFDPSRDVSLPEVNLRTDAVERQVGGPSASRRPVLAFFAGGNHGPVRPALLARWGQGQDPDVQVGEYLPRGASYTDAVRRARFCLCPGGYEVASPRLAEAVYLGCVPVVIDDGDYALPFADVLNWDAFSLRVRVADIPRLKEVLAAVSPRRYVQLQRRVRMVRRHFMVHGGPPRRYDAFHMILHSVWLRRLNVRVVAAAQG